MKLILLLLAFVKFAQGIGEECPNFVILSKPDGHRHIYVKIGPVRAMTMPGHMEPLKFAEPTKPKPSESERLNNELEMTAQIAELKNKFPTLNPAQYASYSPAIAILSNGDIIELCEQQPDAYSFTDIPSKTKSIIEEFFPIRGRDTLFHDERHLYIKPILLQFNEHGNSTFVHNLGDISKVPTAMLAHIFSTNTLKEVELSILQSGVSEQVIKFVPQRLMGQWGEMVLEWAGYHRSLFIVHEAGELSKMHYNGDSVLLSPQLNAFYLELRIQAVMGETKFNAKLVV